MSAKTVAEQCARHVELLEKLTLTALANHDLERAARWTVLLDAVATVFEESVRSPWVYNYVQSKHSGAGLLAQIIQEHPECPPELATQMTGIVARCGSLTPRPAAQSYANVTAFFFENFARSS